jgi:hypothetical protein
LLVLARLHAKREGMFCFRSWLDSFLITFLPLMMMVLDDG